MSDEAKNQFRKEIELALILPHGKNTIGCKIDDAHVRLVSGFHMKDFYDIGVLLQDKKNIDHFAEAIIELLKDQFQIPLHSNSLLLIGTATFLEGLLNTIIQKIKTNPMYSGAEREIEYAIFSNNMLIKSYQKLEVEENQLTFSPGLRNKEKNERNQFFRASQICIISPISATFITYHSLIDHLQQWNIPLTSIINTALFVIGDSTEESFQNEFWNFDDSTPDPIGNYQWKKVSVKKRLSSENDLSVYYLFNADTKWYLPEKCEYCESENEVPLMRVESSSSFPSQIFTDEKSNYGAADYIEYLETKGITSSEENSNRISLLKGCITYGHVVYGSNHYQFYIDVERYYYNAHKEIINWLNNKRSSMDDIRHKVKLVFTPKRNDTTPFSTDVVSRIFNDDEINTYIIHLDTHNLFRENIKSRYKYIIEKLQNISRRNVHFCYIDQMIVSGNTFQRIKSIANIFISETKYVQNSDYEFDSVFVLINRSSISAIRQILSDNSKYHAFLSLAIPNIHSSNNCPTCTLRYKYHVMERRSATNYLSKRYQSLEGKHAPRKLINYKITENEEKKRRHGYYAWMKQYILYNNNTAANEQLIHSIFQMQGADNPVNPRQELETWLREIAGKTIDMFDESDGNQMLAHLKNAVDNRNYLRLWCIHNSFVTFNKEKPSSAQDAFCCIVNMIHSDVCKRDSRYEKAEYYISYIKVLTRDILGMHWLIKQAMFKLVKIFIKAMLIDRDMRINYIMRIDKENGLSSKILDDRSRIGKLGQILQSVFYPSITNEIRIESLSAQLQYQIMITLVKRLSSMQSTYLLTSDTVFKLIECYKKLSDKYCFKQEYLTTETEQQNAQNVLLNLSEIPSFREYSIRLIELIKWTSMSGIDENRDFLTEQTIVELVSKQRELGLIFTESPQYYLNTLHNALWTLYVENNNIIYSGVDTLYHIIRERYREKANNENDFLNDEILSKVKEFMPSSAKDNVSANSPLFFCTGFYLGR